MVKNKKTKNNGKSSNNNMYYALAGILLLAAAGTYLLFSDRSKSTEIVTYTTAIQPVLQQKCVSCHGPGGSVSSIPLDTYSNVRNIVVPGDVNSSKLIQAVDGGTMNGRLTGSEIELFKEWINQGVKE